MWVFFHGSVLFTHTGWWRYQGGSTATEAWQRVEVHLDPVFKCPAIVSIVVFLFFEVRGDREEEKVCCPQWALIFSSQLVSSFALWFFAFHLFAELKFAYICRADFSFKKEKSHLCASTPRKSSLARDSAFHLFAELWWSMCLLWYDLCWSHLCSLESHFELIFKCWWTWIIVCLWALHIHSRATKYSVVYR